MRRDTVGSIPTMGFVVPTRNRPDELRRLLASLAGQSRRPDQVVVVDGGERTVEDVVAEFPTLAIRYRRIYPPSLARQRNVGMQALDLGVQIAGYLDDDLVLEHDALEAMAAFWAQARADVGGAGFNIVNHPGKMHGLWLKSLFFLESRRRGAVLRSGFHTDIFGARETMDVQWLYGGATVWRREVIDRFAYDEWFEGTGHLEDVEYSYRVGQRYRLAVVAAARAHHLTMPIRRDRNYLLGKWEAINRMYFTRKYPELSVLHCYWAIFGQMLMNAGNGLLRRDPGLFWRALGNGVGLGYLVTGRRLRMGGTLK
ncbi:MAG: glycosyltransferase family 2 protein [Armatimonadetes bacterium]|nr:glycosyltransferase family 2 protein [Armatimonadota bacterium]